MAASEHLSDLQFHLQDNDVFGGGSVSAHRGGEYAGELKWWYAPKGPTISEVYVSPEHRRQGVATAMYKHATEQGFNLIHNDRRTDSGEAWSQSLGARKRRHKEPDWELDG